MEGNATLERSPSVDGEDKAHYNLPIPKVNREVMEGNSTLLGSSSVDGEDKMHKTLLPIPKVTREVMEGNATLEESSSVDGEDKRLENGRKEENGDISVEVMTLDDLQKTLKWARQEGWNPGDGDAKAFFNVDEKGFFMAKTTDGEPVVSVAGVRYTEDYGFIGLYICVPEHRGKGYGKFTFGHAMRHLEGKVVGLDGVGAQRSNYAKWGFAVEHRNIRFGGVVDLDALPPPPAQTGEAGDRIVVEDLKEARIGAILKFDEKHVPAARERFMRAWLTVPGHVVRVAIVGDKIKGYGVLRPCCDGRRIGPLFAESATTADLLIRELIAGTSQGAKVFIDIPETNQASVELAGRLGLTETFDTYRMYRGPTPKLPVECIYGLTSLEMG